jgi:hypothetical protein
VEFIRFALLLVVTVALSSVATRIGDDDGTREAGARPTGHATSAPAGNGGSSAGGTSSPDAGTSSPDGTSATPDGGTSSPDGGTSSPDGSTSSPGGGGSDGSGTDGSDSGGSGSGGSSGGSSDSGGAGGTTAPELPRTGNDEPLRLAALALLLLAAGSLSLSVSRR